MKNVNTLSIILALCLIYQCAGKNVIQPLTQHKCQVVMHPLLPGNIITKRVYTAGLYGIDTTTHPYTYSGKIYVYDTLVFADGSMLYSVDGMLHISSEAWQKHHSMIPDYKNQYFLDSIAQNK